MATAKQTRDVYKRVRYHFYQLRKAVNAAHDLDVIEYENGKYSEEAPCWALDQFRQRFEKTTDKALAQALKSELMSELKGIY